MHVQVLSSGSKGNAALVRAGEAQVLVDAGLPLVHLDARLAAAGTAPTRLDHLVVTHGHLDHARSAGALARRAGATLHCCERMMQNTSVRRAKRMSVLRPGSATALPGPGGENGLSVLPVLIPHDADPTVALRLEHESSAGRRIAVVLTDMGRPDAKVAQALLGAHVLVLEFNHDERMLREGPYPPPLKRRVGGDRGHLSNEQAAEMLRRLAGPELHTLVLAHLSETNNTPALARSAAEAVLADIGRTDVRVLVAEQHEPGPNLGV
jgi:phosphoribosyl 1,2-cyclic phosphodiesterase